MIRIEFGTDNSAFDGDDFEYEVERVLQTATKWIQSGRDHGPLHDSNGNIIGWWSRKEDNDD